VWRSASQRRVGGRSNDARTYHAPDTASTAIWLHAKRRKAVVSDAYSPSSVVTTVPRFIIKCCGTAGVARQLKLVMVADG